MQRIVAMVTVLGASYALAQDVRYECDVLPEEAGFLRNERVFPCDRWIADGILVQECEIVRQGPPREGEDDSYRHDLGVYAGADRWRIEWRVKSDALESEIGGVGGAHLVPANNSGMLYHFTMVSTLVRYLHPPSRKVTVQIAPNVFHEYRLDVYSRYWHEWSVDGVVRAAYVPYRTFPTEDSFLGFGGRANVQATLQQWDYIRISAPDPSGVDCDAVERLKARCKGGKLTGKIFTTLERRTKLLVTNNGEHQTAKVKRSGKAKVKYDAQPGERTVLLLDCPAVSDVVECH